MARTGIFPSPELTSEGGDNDDAEVDRDEDTIADAHDNCPGIKNPDQRDTDNDGRGDDCDTDDDGDGILDGDDACPRQTPAIVADLATDPDGDGCRDAVADYTLDGCSLTSTAGQYPGELIDQATSVADRHDNAEAACFFPSHSYIEVPYHADFNSPVFSLTVWAQLDPSAATGAFQSLVTSRDHDPIAGYSLYFRDPWPNCRWVYYLAPDPPNPTGNPWNVLNMAGPTQTDWYHLAIVYDGTHMRLYENGVEVANRPTTFVANTSRPLPIGAGATEQAPDYLYQGALDDVRIYNRALTAAELQVLFAAERP